MNANAVNYKIGIVGPILVGKSAIAMRFIEDKFDGITIITSWDSYSKTFEINGILVKLDITVFTGWDDYEKVIDIFLPIYHGFIFVFDMSDKKSLEKLFNKYNRVLNVISINRPTKSLPCVIAANKSDLVTDQATRNSVLERARNIAEQMNCKVIETSPKTPLNINELFLEITERLMKTNQNQKKNKCLIS